MHVFKTKAGRRRSPSVAVAVEEGGGGRGGGVRGALVQMTAL